MSELIIREFWLLVKCLKSEGLHILFKGGCRIITHHFTLLTRRRRSRRRERMMAVMMTLVAQMVTGRYHQIVGYMGTSL
jgi:hypothetical protein